MGSLYYFPVENSPEDIPKIKAHEVRVLSSSWAFFDKAPLNEILKAAVKKWVGCGDLALDAERRWATSKVYCTYVKVINILYMLLWIKIILKIISWMYLIP